MSECIEGRVYLSDCLSQSSVEMIESLPAVSYTRKPVRDIYFSETAINKDKYLGRYQRCSAHLPGQGLYKIKDAEVRGKGLIKLDGALVRDNLEGAPEQKILEALADRDSAKNTIEEPVLYVTRYGIKNYGHCLTDVIPRIMWFYEKMPDVKLALHPEMPAQIYEALQIAGIPHDSIIELDDGNTHISTMYFISLWNKHPLVHTPRAMGYVKNLKVKTLETLKNTPEWNTAPSKIFVGRKDSNTRQIANYDEVIALLTSEGYVEISSGDLSFTEQVTHFSAARSVVGIAGAAMTNIAFCPEGTSVLALAPDSMPALYFWDMAHHANLDYGVAYFSGIERRNTLVDKSEDIFANFSVDVPVLEELIRSGKDE